MADDDAWQALAEEFKQIESDEKYKPFRPLLDKLRPFIEVTKLTQKPEERFAAEATLNVLKNLQEEFNSGKRVDTHISEISGGFVQPGWMVRGGVKQANQDYLDYSKTIIKNIFVQVGDLKLSNYQSFIPVPIVLVVMTRAEADDLLSGDAFDPVFSVLQKDFTELCTRLRSELNSEKDDWLNRYGQDPLDWKPFGGEDDGASIGRLIEDALAGLEQEGGVNISRPLVPDFIDIRTLANLEQRSRLRELREKGCIVLLDVVSLRHPKLQQAFHRTLLDAFPKTSVVCLSTSENFYNAAARLAIIIQMKSEELEFHQRSKDTGDYGQSEKFTGTDRLRAWLSARVLKLDLPFNGKAGAPKIF